MSDYLSMLCGNKGCITTDLMKYTASESSFDNDEVSQFCHIN